MQQDYLNSIVEALSTGECPTFDFNDDEEFKPFDEYIDYLLFNKYIIKESPYHFYGVKYADLINNKLSILESPYRLYAVRHDDKRLSTHIKGQGCYFILTKNNEDMVEIIFDWSWTPFHMFELK